MALSKTFDRELNGLFHQRTAWLRQKLGSKIVGKRPKFGRKKVNAGIQRLQDIASDAFASKLAKSEFDKYVKSRKDYRIKGYGRDDKKSEFEWWFTKNFGKTKGLIYAFWGKHKKSIYIGRTGSHGSRPSSHFVKYWFARVKRITIFDIRTKSQIPKLECLAIHHFQPSYNKSKAATKKWTKACPLCETHKHIEDELHDIFRFR
jgi:hypothetical protein